MNWELIPLKDYDIARTFYIELPDTILAIVIPFKSSGEEIRDAHVAECVWMQLSDGPYLIYKDINNVEYISIDAVDFYLKNPESFLMERLL